MTWWTTEVSHLVDWNMFCALCNSSELNKCWRLDAQGKIYVKILKMEVHVNCKYY